MLTARPKDSKAWREEWEGGLEPGLGAPCLHVGLL